AFADIAGMLKPILPGIAARVEQYLGGVELAPGRFVELDGRTLAAYTPLFTRIDPKRIDAMTEASRDTLSTKPEAAAAAKPAEAPQYVGIDDFARLDLRVGKVLECGFVEGSDKLLRFVLDAGELGQRQIFSGIRASYGEPEKLIGRHVVFIANLAPRKMRFGLSEGMILSAGFDGGALALLDVDDGAQPGMPVRWAGRCRWRRSTSACRERAATGPGRTPGPAAAADPVRPVRLRRLPPLRRGHGPQRSGHRPLPARGRCRRARPGTRARRGTTALRPRPRRAQATSGRAHRGGRLHRLHPLHPGLPGRRHRRRQQAHAHRPRAAVHRLRAVPARLPGGLHRDAPGRGPGRAGGLKRMPAARRRHAPGASGYLRQAEQMRSTS